MIKGNTRISGSGPRLGAVPRMNGCGTSLLLCATGLVLTWCWKITPLTGTSGYPTTTRSHWKARQHTPKNSSTEKKQEPTSTSIWDKACCEPPGLMEDTLQIWHTSEIGNATGILRHTLPELCAARRSCFAPDEVPLHRWCNLHYPCWATCLWPNGPPGTLAAPPSIDLHSLD